MQTTSQSAQSAIQSVVTKPAVTKATPLSLDTYHVNNWSASYIPAATLNPDAGLHQQLAWLYGQVTEINDLLWGFIQTPEAALDANGEVRISARSGMAESLLLFVEGRTTAMVRMLEYLCEQTAEAEAQSEG